MLACALLVGCASDGLPDVDPAAAPPPAEQVTDESVLVPGAWPAVADYVVRTAARGRPVLVNAFASWCAPCTEELPLLVAAAARHPDVAFLGVAHQDREDLAVALVEEFAIPYATVFDATGDTVVTLGAAGMPVTALFDTRARIVRLQVGQLDAATIEEWLAEVDD